MLELWNSLQYMCRYQSTTYPRGEEKDFAIFRGGGYAGVDYNSAIIPEDTIVSLNA
jgi:hypothetical protein